jgi:D-alanyl-D-alanine carboxypeptidase (penicillin-binding protein 5/6)
MRLLRCLKTSAMSEPLFLAVRGALRVSALTLAGAAVVLSLALGSPQVYAQNASTPATKPAPKGKGEPAAPAKPAPSEAAVSAKTPSPLTPVQVGEMSSVPAPTIAARAWISVDVTSGQVVASSNADQKVEPASLTKIMTAYLAFTAIKEKRLTLEQQANVSTVAWKTRGSRMFIEPRKPVTVDELLKGVIIQSGNDASVALAEAVSGSEAAFVDNMNKEAARMGMVNTVFKNSTGLPDPEHVTTVRDLAIIARRMINDHLDYFPYYSMREFTYNKIGGWHEDGPHRRRGLLPGCDREAW